MRSAAFAGSHPILRVSNVVVLPTERHRKGTDQTGRTLLDCPSLGVRHSWYQREKERKKTAIVHGVLC
ncbi:unnamed protein product [Ectocarpus sp. CCAP 1310/34]|nr:unnamed protein product [Ectocarpus sp. CCAP 1310/34]